VTRLAWAGVGSALGGLSGGVLFQSRTAPFTGVVQDFRSSISPIEVRTVKTSRRTGSL